MADNHRHILFVTGTRAELGLMRRTLAAIEAHPKLVLSVVATGMHLDPRANPGGAKLSALRAAGVTPVAVVDWAPQDHPAGVAETTGMAISCLAQVYRRIKADVIVVVGDRVEAFAAATAAHIARIPVAHIHGGDRAEGQVDDSLRHAITKLAHLHLAATKQSATRIAKLGERKESIHVVGAPGVEAIREEAASVDRSLQNVVPVLLHPSSPDDELEYRRAMGVCAALKKAGAAQIYLLDPNNDPGASGIRRAWRELCAAGEDVRAFSDIPRPKFLGMLRDCRMLAGNSSAGIIEAASFGTPVLNIGPRQAGRLHGANVTTVSYVPAAITVAARKILGRPRRKTGVNPYAQRNTARRIAELVASPKLTVPAPSKLITY